MRERATFGSKIGVILAAAGSAVGLGNIWKFPYEAGKNGGGAFLLIYMACVLLLSLTVLIAEFFMGRSTRKGVVGAFDAMSPNKAWKAVGYNGILAVLLIMGFYSVVSGWTLEYVFQSATGGLDSLSTEQFQTRFTDFSSSIFRPLIWIVLFFVVVHFIIISGVERGIERWSKILMPLLFVMLIVLCVRSLMLPGATDGLKFLFKPDFGKINYSIVISALGQAFFSISVGLGCMTTYASYFGSDVNIPKSALSVVWLDTFIAMLAGIMIFPAVFSFGIAPSKGPELAFITLPNIFKQLPFGSFWSFVFFMLLAIAALTSIISMHEEATAYFVDELQLSRRRATFTVTLIGLALGVVCSLSFGVINHIRIGGYTFFDLFDSLTTKIMLPLGGMCICIFVGWFVDKKHLRNELTNGGKFKFLSYPLFIFLLKFIAPVIIALIFFAGFGAI